jgi:ABC-type Fe3+-hydroxamate transport system substrate-binding protein
LLTDPAASPPRIASLVPSLTELVCALGLAERLVARTGFCVHPAEAVRAVPKVGGTKDVNLARLRELAPTHALLNIDENTLATHEAVQAFVPHCVVTHPLGPGDVPALIDQLAQAFADEPSVLERAAALQAELSAALSWAPPKPPRRVLYLIWRGPWMTVARDTYISRLLAHAGFDTQPAEEGGERGAARYPALAPDDPLWRAVDEVWLSSEPYRFDEAHLAEVQALAPQARVRLVDGELCSWWGARTAAGLAYARSLRDNPRG